MKLAIIGSRNYPGPLYSIVAFYLDKLTKPDMIISGGARGVDTAAAEVANAKRIPLHVIKAEWDTNGRIAGKLRNWDIANECDEMLAFWDGMSPGTAHAIAAAVTKGKPVTVILPEKS